MKFLTSLLLLLSLSSAAADCYLFGLQGEVQSDNDRLILRLGEESLSDIKLMIPINEQLKALPFLDEWTKSYVVVRGSTLSTQMEILKIQSIKMHLRDPLNDVPQETRRLKGEVPCP